MNSIASGDGPDTKADQAAVAAGFLHEINTEEFTQGIFKDPTFNHRRDNRDNDNTLRKTDRHAARQ